MSTHQDYLVRDNHADEKPEYYDGTIVAQAGATARHNLIIANLIGHLYAQVQRNGCHIFPSDMRVQAVDQRVYTYTDLTIVCGTPQYTEPAEQTLLNPIVIMEVLSSSTEARDRKEKLVYYRSIESLQAYVLVSQTTPYVQYYARQTLHFWHVHLFDELTDQLALDAVNCMLSLENIYEAITF